MQPLSSSNPVPRLLAGSSAQIGYAANSESTTVPCTATTKQWTFRVPRQVRATAHMVCERGAPELGPEVDATVSGISRSNPSCRASSCGPTPRAVRVTNPHASGLRSVGRCLGNDAAQHKRNTTEREAKHRDRGLRQRRGWQVRRMRTYSRIGEHHDADPSDRDKHYDAFYSRGHEAGGRHPHAHTSVSQTCTCSYLTSRLLS